MAVKHTAEVTISDLSDAYSVTLTNEAASFKATSDTKMGTAGTATTKPQAFMGSDAVACFVTAADCVCSDSTNVSVTVNSTGDNATWPLLTITVGANATAGGTVTIPVVIGNGSDAVTITKVFSYSIALKGTTGGVGPGAYNYALLLSPDAMVRAQNGTLTPTSFTASATRLQGTGNPASYSGRFKIEELSGSTWTVKYTSSANEASKSYSPTSTAEAVRVSLYLAGGTSTLLQTRTVAIANDGATGGPGATGKGITSVTSSFANNNSTTAPADSAFSTTMTPPTSSNKYLWERDLVTYTDSSTAWTTKHIVGTYGEKGDQGDPGDDPYTLSLTSDNGTVLRNNTGDTTLTAHVYQAGAELLTMPADHSIKWYVDGTLTETDNSLPATFTRTAAQVANKIVVCAKLEG